MSDNQVALNHEQKVEIELKNVRREVAEIISARLARGNLSLQHSRWPSDEKWKQRKLEHAEKLDFLLTVIRQK